MVRISFCLRTIFPLIAALLVSMPVVAQETANTNQTRSASAVTTKDESVAALVTKEKPAIPVAVKDEFAISDSLKPEPRKETSSQDTSAPPTPAQEEALRKAALNPVASLISVPIQNNSSFDIGPHNRIQNVINIQPVIPISLTENWNLIMRIIQPIIFQPDPTTSTEGAFGFGDMNPTFFFSPSHPGKIIWGAGPAFVLPTAASRTLGQGKFSMGPGLVVLYQPGKWTLGFLANNVWSVAGKESREAVNQGVFQYFINYNLNKGYYLTWQPTLSVNWRATGAQSNQRWLIPFGGGIGRIMKLGNQPVNLGVQAYANAVRPPGSSPFMLRFQIAFLYPKKPKK